MDEVYGFPRGIHTNSRGIRTNLHGYPLIKNIVLIFRIQILLKNLNFINFDSYF